MDLRKNPQSFLLGANKNIKICRIFFSARKLDAFHMCVHAYIQITQNSFVFRKYLYIMNVHMYVCMYVCMHNTQITNTQLPNISALEQVQKIKYRLPTFTPSGFIALDARSVFRPFEEFFESCEIRVQSVPTRFQTDSARK
jgi:hypothetical protein